MLRPLLRITKNGRRTRSKPSQGRCSSFDLCFDTCFDLSCFDPAVQTALFASSSSTCSDQHHGVSQNNLDGMVRYRYGSAYFGNPEMWYGTYGEILAPLRYIILRMLRTSCFTYRAVLLICCLKKIGCQGRRSFPQKKPFTGSFPRRDFRLEKENKGVALSSGMALSHRTCLAVPLVSLLAASTLWSACAMDGTTQIVRCTATTGEIVIEVCPSSAWLGGEF